MLNYILPPIIIIVSVAILIVFLFRKAEKIPEQALTAKEDKSDQENRKSAIASAIGQFWLKFLEKIMQRLKLMSLKFHNVSNNWFHSIREKRQQRDLMQQENQKKEKIEDIPEEQIVFKETAIIEEKIRPLIRETATHPQKNAIDKNKLEEALIRRIAVNPRDIEAYERLGDYYLEKENYCDSHECFSQVLMLSPTHRKARLRIRRLKMMIK